MITFIIIDIELPTFPPNIIFSFHLNEEKGLIKKQINTIIDIRFFENWFMYICMYWSQHTEMKPKEKLWLTDWLTNQLTDRNNHREYSTLSKQKHLSEKRDKNLE